MKELLDRTKVVVRQLPPSISQQALMEQIDGRFAGRYDWACFCPGKNSQKNQRSSRAYLNFRRPEDVVEFAEFFNGHTFVNEKGVNFKAIVEFAPSQHVPKACIKKDGREGTILKDPDYLAFLELLSKPVENLPSAEIQYERREAEKAGAAKETPIVTPLMVYVRQKRAAKCGPQRASGSTRLSRRASGIPTNSSSPSKRGSDRRRISSSMYVLRDRTRNEKSKERPTFILLPRREEQPVKDKSIAVASASASETMENDIAAGSNEAIYGSSGAAEAGKNKVVFLKGREREGYHASRGSPVHHDVTSSVRSSTASTAKQDQCLDPTGKIIRSILLNKEGKIQSICSEKDKRPPRPPSMRSILKDPVSSHPSYASVSDNDDKRYYDEKISVGSLSIYEKHDRRSRNKDRPDRGVWTPRRSEKSRSIDGTLSPSSDPAQAYSDSSDRGSLYQQATGIKDDCLSVQNAHIRHDTVSRREDFKSYGSGRISPQLENGSHKHLSHRGPSRSSKEVEGSLGISEGKHTRRGFTGYGAHERQVWVQKSGSAS
ncbi:regulator of nonsense transcripts UPF3-like isoform X1 [Ananas comosus]|uniref:Regulator of nonsense transcripts UPF3-like isoform X1 n=1 Tax=Ananas comosus TaxID=4615 RepID=A0A6P5GKZ0_ANACO|nr:regulator of nonsense transcripts UPF3-like isoform X1 [Ananas comosus]